MQLLTELVASNEDIEIITESDDKTGKKKTRIRAPFMVSEKRNKNRRMYKRHIISDQVDKYNKTKIATKSAFGALDHEDTPSISGKEIAIHTDKLYMDGNIAIGEATILSTPNGEIIKGVLEDGYSWGVSSRGLGTLNGQGYVNNDYDFICEDVVTDPSAHEAIVERLLENKDYFINEFGKAVEIAVENLQEKVDKKFPSDSRYKSLLVKEFIRDIQKKL